MIQVKFGKISYLAVLGREEAEVRWRRLTVHPRGRPLLRLLRLVPLALAPLLALAGEQLIQPHRVQVLVADETDGGILALQVQLLDDALVHSLIQRPSERIFNLRCFLFLISAVFRMLYQFG